MPLFRAATIPPHHWSVLRERIVSCRAARATGCMEWQGSTDSGGYGVIGFGGTTWKVHRVTWMVERGPIPFRTCVLHRCDNPPCCNPDHLFLGTQADNIRDMVRKGRASSGNSNKTHCVRGHEFTEANTYMGKGWRKGAHRHSCRKCQAIRQRMVRVRRALRKATTEAA